MMKQPVSTITMRGFRACISTFFVLTILLAAAPMPASANHAANATIGECMVDRFNATKPASNTDLNCTSNDVSLAIYEVVSGPATCFAGEEIMVVLKGDFIATSSERWDVGVFVSTDGGTPNALGGSCYQDYLHPVSADNSDIDLSGGFGPYHNGEITEDPADTCGDIEQDQDATFVTEEFPIICQDTDEDGQADVFSCTVWANSRSDGDGKPSCNSEADVTAETTAKCTCDPVNIIGIDFREHAFIEVVKETTPTDDPGFFDLEINGAAEYTDAQHDDATGPVQVSAGTTLMPGDTHTVGESAGTGTSLANYASSISCVDRGMATFDGGAPLTANNAGPLNVDVDPDDDIVCTITNTNICSQANCSSMNTTCATFSCDLNGAVNNCDTVNYASSDTVCRTGSGDACDPDETCTGSSADCPADTVQPNTTVCRMGSGDQCDPDELCTGNPGDMCPSDSFQPNTTVCRTGSGDQCDPDELCTGNPGDSCPDDSFQPNTTVCRTGSGDQCDPDELCTGNPGDMCPSDSFEPNTTVCNASTGECDPEELCTGNPGDMCPANMYSAQGTPCSSDGNICTDDECDMAGMCTHLFNSDPCDDGNECTLGDMCVDGMCEPGPGSCDTLCRTPGFWGARGGDDNDAFNVTQAVIDLNGGMLNVCGEVITKTDDIGGLDSALEGLCVSVRGVSQRQLYRQLVAFNLNCVLSGATGDCDALVDIASECDALCATGSSTEVDWGECIGQIDCFNNGGQIVDGRCATGTCEHEPEVFCGSRHGMCPLYEDQPQDCDNFEGNCHDAALCPDGGAFCYEPLSRAGGKRDCFDARHKNDCTIDSCP